MDDKTEAWVRVMIPMVRKIIPQRLASEVVGVQPMSTIFVTEEEMWKACLAIEMGEKLEADLVLDKVKP